ncbi:MAG: hypothetical protein HYX43_14170 [Burkholderiales bacterium]|nr:hypothetical protein [Burkholderiales bacterium]
MLEIDGPAMTRGHGVTKAKEQADPRASDWRRCPTAKCVHWVVRVARGLATMTNMPIQQRAIMAEIELAQGISTVVEIAQLEQWFVRKGR